MTTAYALHTSEALYLDNLSTETHQWERTKLHKDRQQIEADHHHQWKTIDTRYLKDPLAKNGEQQHIPESPHVVPAAEWLYAGKEGSWTAGWGAEESKWSESGMNMLPLKWETDSISSKWPEGLMLTEADSD